MDGEYHLQENSENIIQNPQVSLLFGVVFDHEYEKAIKICKEILTYEKVTIISNTKIIIIE